MGMVHDLKCALRSLARNPGLALTAIVALALGIGANTALFTVFNSVLLRPMNYPRPQRIVEVERRFQQFDAAAVSAFKFDFWRSHNHSFSRMGAYDFLPAGANLSGSGEPVRVTALRVSAGFFPTLGVQPMIGRTFSESEDQPGAAHTVILSYGLWKRRFNGDPGILGRAIALSGESSTVIGVMPADFDFPDEAELWTALQLKFDATDISNDFKVIARLRDGVSLAQASADLNLISANLRRQNATLVGPTEGVRVIGYHDQIVGDVRPALRVLMGAVGFLLLLACANVANLMLARAAARHHEIAVRTALGAGRWRLIRQFLTESVLLAVAGGVVGIVLAAACLPLLLHLAPADLPLVDSIHLDSRALAFSFAAALTTGILFGLFPALQSVRIGATLRESGTRTTAGAASNRARHILVVGEVAISLVLLAGAALLIETFAKLSGVSPGFDPRNVLTTDMTVKPAAAAQAIERVTSRLEALPGVASAGTTIALPLQIGPDLPFEIAGHPVTLKDMPDEEWRIISPHYFSALRIPVLAGRAFTEQDTRQAPGVLIVNQAFARRYFPHRSALGETILIGRVMGARFRDVPRQIVGVIADTRDDSLGSDPPPILFEPLAQAPEAIVPANMHWTIRVARVSPSLPEQIRREVLAASGGVPVSEPHPLEDVVGASIAQQRFSMTLLSVFAGLALVLASVGLYGVISYSVTQRTRELGIRSALGANRASLLGLVLGQGMKLSLAGIAAGLVAALALTRLLRSMLYGVGPSDPFVFSMVAALLAVVALAACWAPARRASRIDPLEALREE